MREFGEEGEVEGDTEVEAVRGAVRELVVVAESELETEPDAESVISAESV